MTALYRKKWFLPLFSLFLGACLLAAMWVGGSLRSGLWSLAVMGVLALVLLVGGRSETIRGLRGDGRDERWTMIDLRATALAGSAVTTSIIVGFLVEVARGHDGSPYAWLGAIGGLTYAAGVALGRFRS